MQAHRLRDDFGDSKNIRLIFGANVVDFHP
jgi:hypothetical protein